MKTNKTQDASLIIAVRCSKVIHFKVVSNFLITSFLKVLFRYLNSVYGTAMCACACMFRPDMSVLQNEQIKRDVYYNYMLTETLWKCNVNVTRMKPVDKYKIPQRRYLMSIADRYNTVTGWQQVSLSIHLKQKQLIVNIHITYVYQSSKVKWQPMGNVNRKVTGFVRIAGLATFSVMTC